MGGPPMGGGMPPQYGAPGGGGFGPPPMGYPPGGYAPMGALPPNESLAIVALVAGILSLVCMGAFAGIPAVICGHLGLGKIKRSGGQLRGGGMAIAGLVMGYVSIGLTVIVMLFYGAVIAAAIAGSAT